MSLGIRQQKRCTMLALVSEDTKAEMFWGWLKDEPGNC